MAQKRYEDEVPIEDEYSDWMLAREATDARFDAAFAQMAAAVASSFERPLQPLDEYANCNEQSQVFDNRSMNAAQRREEVARREERFLAAMVARNVADAAASAIRDLIAVNVGLQRLSPPQFDRYRDAVRALDQLYQAVSDGRQAPPASASSPK